MASSLASSSSSSNSVLSARILYRSLLRELRSNPNNVPPPDSRRITSSLQFRSQPIVSLVREAFRADAEGSAALSEMRNLELYLRSNRTHKELLNRYNPLHGQTEQERVKATARRVGLEVLLEYCPGDAATSAAPKN